MIGPLVALISLNVTLAMVQSGQVAGSFPITGATATTPIAITCANHGVPTGRKVHAVVSGVTGTVEANGLWELTPTDPNTFTLAVYTAQGLVTQSSSVNAYTGGGVAQFAFPDWQVLLGRRNIALASAVAAPRIVFVPMQARAIGFEPFAAQGQAYKSLGSLEQQSMKLSYQEGTDYTTFEVHFIGCANPPSPDFLDFDATQQLSWTLYNVLWDAFADRADVKRVDWLSQLPANHPEATGTMTQRGQHLRWILELQQPITSLPEQFVPLGAQLQITVEPVNPASGDATLIVIT